MAGGGGVCVWQGSCKARGVCMAGGMCGRGACVERGVHGRGVHGRGDMRARGHAWHICLPVDRMTDRCKIITLPQLRCGR